MKMIFVLPLVVSLSIFCSCQKQQTDAERQAEIDREVQQRLDAEHQAQEKEQLAQRGGELNAREKALAEKESAPAKTRESESRSSRTEPRATQTDEERPTASYNTFYTKLDPYGEWRETSDYGYVWQPREAQSRTWRPYTDGRWVYTDVGWTWVSEEPFGWATYHYGRWTRLRNIGWVWVPDDEWAPAWVSWRKSDDYVGWAPLPPEARFDRRTGIHNWSDNYYDIGPEQYCFVETKQFGAPRIQSSVLPTERNVTIVNQTTNVTNITYNNRTVVNQGPSYDELRTRTAQPIERLRLERQVNLNVNVEAPRPVVRGGVVVIPAPLIARGQAVERPRTVRETIANVVVERGWEAITDRRAAEKVRIKMRSEATPPPDAPPKTFVKPAQARAETPAPSATSTSSPAASATAAPSATPEASATVAATTTPFHRATPEATATPIPSATTTVTPRPTFSPRPLPGSTSSPLAPASPTATVQTFSPNPSVERPRPGKRKPPIRRLTEEQGNTPPPSTSASASPAATPAAPNASASPLLRDKREARKEERQLRKEERKNRKRGMEQVPDENNASPSATPTPPAQ